MRIDSERDLAQCLQVLGELREAERLLDAVYQVCVTHFGEDHEKTKACGEELAAVREARANSDDGN